MLYRASSLLAIVALGSVSAACARVDARKTNSRLHTVNVPQTDARNQHAGSICWAYATASLLEAETLSKTGKEVDLSEEAIAFFAQLEKFIQLSKIYSAEELTTMEALDKAIEEQGLDIEGWTVRAWGGNQRGVPDGLALVSKYGAVPESVWSKKFENWYSDGAEFANLAKKRFLKLMEGRRPGGFSAKEIIDGVLVGPGAYHSAPPSDFEYVMPNGEKKNFTSVEFAKNVLQFNSGEYEVEYFRGVEDLPGLISLLKLALVQGVSPVLNFKVDFHMFDDKAQGFLGRGHNLDDFKEDGGHAVLVTDFVNKGGSAGAMTKEEIMAEFRKPASDFDYLVIKNSWGRSPIADRIRARGLITMDREYLEAQLRNGVGITVVVPGLVPSARVSPADKIVLQEPLGGSSFVQVCENPAVSGAETLKTVDVLKELVPGATCAEKWVRLSNLVELDLSGSDLSDLTPLAGLTRLRSLYLAKNRVTDLAPLASLASLANLDVTQNAIVSVEPLRVLKNLQTLNLANNAIVSLEPIVGADRLTELVVSGNPVSSLAPVAASVRLQRLLADGIAARDHSALASLRGLRELSLRGNGLESLKPLATLTKLERLDLSGNALEDVRPLVGLQRLFRLKIGNNRISDATALAELKNLMNVDVGGNPLTSIEFLRGLPRLRFAYLNGIPVGDVTPLTAHPDMVALYLDNAGLSDAAFLGTFARLEVLSLNGNAIADFSPLAALTKLDEVFGDGNPVDKSDRSKCPVENVSDALKAFCQPQ